MRYTASTLSAIAIAAISLLSPATALAAFAVPWYSTSTSQGWVMPSRVSGVEQAVVGSRFVASSTVPSVLPNASTTNISATTVCLVGDSCRTTWPTGGGSSFGQNWSYITGLAGTYLTPTTSPVGIYVTNSTSTVTNIASINSTTTNATTTYLYAAGGVSVASTSPYGLLSINGNGISGPQLVVGSSTATNFMVDNGGYTYVGAGTNAVAPISKFPLVVSDSGTDLAQFNKTGGTSGFSRLGFRVSTSGGTTDTAYLEWNRTNSPSSGDTYLALGNTKSGTLSESMRVTTAGTVGIASTSPSATLGVGGSMWAAGNLTLNASAPALFLTDSSQAAPAGNYRIDTSGDLLRFIRSASVLGVFDGNGRLGVSTTSPDSGASFNNYSGRAVVHIGDDSTNDGRTRLLVENRWSGNDNYGLMVQRSSSIPELVVTGAGNVGIATSTPAYQLQVNGTIDAYTNDVRGQRGVFDNMISRSAGSITFQQPINVGTNSVRGGQSANDNLTLDSTSNATKGYVIIQPNGGNLGISTTSPYAKLSVSMSSSTPSLAIGVAGSSTPSLFVDSANNNGNVGIRTTSPLAPLHVGSTANPGIQVGDGTTGSVKIGDATIVKTSGSFWSIAGINSGAGNASVVSLGFGALNTGLFGSSNTIQFSVSGTERGRFDSTGYFGISTSSPYSVLSISNSATTAVNTPLLTIASTTAGTATSTLMTVLANGNTGIATTSPFTKLSVAGSAYIGGDLTATGTASTTNQYVSSLGKAAGTFVAADPSGKLIATTSPSGSGTAVNVQNFESSGTWTKPAGVTYVQIVAIGGGGGGAVGQNSSNVGGGGGGGGIVRTTIPASLLASTVTVTVGAGGPGSNSALSDGTAGGDSSFGTWVLASGGSGGKHAGGTSSAGGSGGRGMGAGSASGIDASLGGAGGGGSNSQAGGNACMFGAAGGGSGGVSGANAGAGGGNPCRGTSLNGGTTAGTNGDSATQFEPTGGAGGGGNATGTGGNGGLYGGGGGGTSNTGTAGGNGANGFVQVVSW